MSTFPSLISALALQARALLVASLAGLVPFAAQAATACVHDVSLVFTESAPRDRFELINESSPGQRVQRLTLNLAGSAGRLIFDTVEGGTGVEVFQPFRVESGEARLSKTPVVQDGSDRLELTFTRFDPGQRLVFSIDVDDRLTASDLGQTRVAGSEMAGALLSVVAGPTGDAGREAQARVDGSNRARVQAACL